MPEITTAQTAEAGDEGTLREAADKTARGWLEAYRLPLNNRAYPMLPSLTRELVSFGMHARAPLLADNAALRTRAEEAEQWLGEASAAVDRTELERDGCASLAGAALAENMVLRALNTATTADRDRLAERVKVLTAENVKFARWLGFTPDMNPSIRSGCEASHEIYARFLEQQRARTQAHSDAARALTSTEGGSSDV